MRSVRINLTPRIAPGVRLPVVDELKGLALVMVLLYHAGGILLMPNNLHGEIGVDIFLFVSGFTLALTSAGMPIGAFVKRRFLRIFPSYWLALGLFVWLQARYLGVRYSWDDIWQHAAGIHGFSRLAYFSSISDSFWFISMIIAAYAVFGLIRNRLDDLSLVCAVCGVLTSLAVTLYQYNHHDGGLISLAVRIPSFFAGVVAGRLLGAGTGEIRFNPALGIGLFSAYYLTFIRGIIPAYTVPAIGIIAAWVALRPYLARVAIGRRLTALMAATGVISYEIYLFHQPLMRDFNVHMYKAVLQIPDPTREQLIRGMVYALIVTVAISIAVHAAVTRLFRRPRPPGAQA